MKSSNSCISIPILQLALQHLPYPSLLLTHTLTHTISHRLLVILHPYFFQLVFYILAIASVLALPSDIQVLIQIAQHVFLRLQIKTRHLSAYVGDNESVDFRLIFSEFFLAVDKVEQKGIENNDVGIVDPQEDSIMLIQILSKSGQLLLIQFQVNKTEEIILDIVIIGIASQKATQQQMHAKKFQGISIQNAVMVQMVQTFSKTFSRKRILELPVLYHRLVVKFLSLLPLLS